jgi:hypothetical protein
MPSLVVITATAERKSILESDLQHLLALRSQRGR